MNIERKQCEKCNETTEVVFLLINRPVTIYSKEKLVKFIHTSIDGNIFRKLKKGWKYWIPIFKPARYVIGYSCDKCKLLTVDYSKVLYSKEAKLIAKELIEKAEQSPHI